MGNWLRQSPIFPTTPRCVMPYGRALKTSHGDAFTGGVLASQIQMAAGLGAEGVILWALKVTIMVIAAPSYTQGSLASPAPL